MKKLLLVLSLLFSFSMGLLIIPGEVSAATEMVQLVPGNLPIEIKAGDVLHFNRTDTAINNILYTEYFRNNPAESSIWGFSSTGTGHYVRYNGTSVMLEGGSWNSHAFTPAFTDDWVDWSFVGNIGTLEFLQDWPTPIVGLYSSVAMTTPKTAWQNSTNISVFTNLEQTITVEPSVGILPTDLGFLISVSGSVIDADALFQIIEVGDTYQLASKTGLDVLVDNVNYVDIYSVLGSSTNPIVIAYGDGELMNSTIYERFSGALGTSVRVNHPLEALESSFSITDLGTSLREIKIYDGVTLVETYTDLSYAMGGTWIAVVIDNFDDKVLVKFMNELVEISSGMVDLGVLLANPGTPTKEGFIFVGWETATGHIWDFNNDTVEAATTLTAKYVAEGTVLHTITFNTNGGSVVSDLSIEDGTIAVAPTAPTRTGYIFTGWYSNQLLTSLFSFTGTEIVADLTLYAKWTPVVTGGGTIVPEASTLTTTQIVIISLALVVIAASVLVPKKKKVGSKR